jgi:hypothetical protein
MRYKSISRNKTEKALPCYIKRQIGLLDEKLLPKQNKGKK